MCACVYTDTQFCVLIHICNIQMCTYPCKYIAIAASMFVWIYVHMKITDMYLNVCICR